MAGIIGLDPQPGRQSWEWSLGEFVGMALRLGEPDKVFLEIAGEKITYRQFHDRVLRTAGMFRDLGIDS